MVLALPALALAADVASPPTPNGSSADPALVRSLQDHHWTLKSGVEAGGEPIEGLVVPGNSFVMRFEGARVAVQGSCNNLVGTWRMSPHGQLIVSRPREHWKACSPELMKADATISAVLAQPLDVQLQSGATTTCAWCRRRRRGLRGPADDGKPVRRADTHIPRSGACRRWRYTRGVAQTQLASARAPFDDAGWKVGTPGEWQISTTRSRATHTPGERNVLRIHRYERSPVPADASAYVHVLDMVVESEKTSTVE
jgi:heat shock protein HslJ